MEPWDIASPQEVVVGIDPHHLGLGWPSGSSVVSVETCFPQASSTTFGWRPWSSVFAATHPPAPLDAHKDEEPLVSADNISSTCASRLDRRLALGLFPDWPN